MGSMNIGKYEILVITAINHKEEDWDDPEWYRCSIRYLIGMIMLKRVRYWKFEFWIWPPVRKRK